MMGTQNEAIFTCWVAFRSIVFQCCFGLAFRVGFGRAPDQKSSDSVREVLQNLGFREGCKNTGFGLYFGSILAPCLAPWVQFLRYFWCHILGCDFRCLKSHAAVSGKSGTDPGRPLREDIPASLEARGKGPKGQLAWRQSYLH